MVEETEATEPATEEVADTGNGDKEKADKPGNKGKAATKEERIIASFVKQSGYEESDILEVNEQTRTVVTSNGGKYQLTGKGGLRTLSGPPTPNELEEAAAAPV